jgi:hypothetical protein
VAEVDRLRQELANQRERRREWAYKRSQARPGTPTWNEAQRECKEAHNRIHDLEERLKRLGG